MSDDHRDELKIRTLVGIGWTSISRILTLVLQVVSSTVVARHLSSSDLGMIGFANIFIGFLSRFTSFGIDNAIIQRKQLQDSVLSAAFSLQIALGVAAFLTTVLVAPFARYLIGHAEAGHVIIALGLTFVLGVLGFLPVCLLTRELRYERLSTVNTARALARCLLIVGLVFLGFNYWAIVLGELGATAIFVIAVVMAHPVPVLPRWERADARSLIRFATPLLGTNLLVFLVFNADNFAIGSVAGATVLGYYVVAFNWGSLVCSLLSETVNSVLFPAFAKMQDDVDSMKRLYLRTLRSVGFLAVLANSCLLAASRDFLVVALGGDTDKWLPALTCLQVLCVYGMVRALIEPVGNVLTALGRTSALFRANAFASAIEIGFLLWVLRAYGISGVALLVTLAYAVQVAVYLPVVTRELRISVQELLKVILPLAFASGLAVYVGSVFLGPLVDGSWFTLLERIIVTAATFMLVHGLLTSFRVFRETFALTTWVLSRDVK